MKDDPLYRALPDSFDERVPAIPEPPRIPKTWDIVVMSFLFLLVAVGLLVGVIPKFADVYAQVKVPTVAMAKILFGLSRAVTHHLWIVGPALIVLPWSLGRLRGRGATLARYLIPALAISSWLWGVLVLFHPLIGCTLR